MFKCKNCQTLEGHLAFERERSNKLFEHIMSLVDAKSYQNVKLHEHFAVSDDSGEEAAVEIRNEFGEKILIKRDERSL